MRFDDSGYQRYPSGSFRPFGMFWGWVGRRPSGGITTANLCGFAGHDPHRTKHEAAICLKEAVLYRKGTGIVVCFGHLKRNCAPCASAELSLLLNTGKR